MISMLDNIGYKGQKPDNARSSFATIDEMVAYSENYLPPIYITLVEETGKQYMYQRSNAVDSTLGKWRELTNGGSVDAYTKSETDAKIKVNADNIGDMTTLVVASWTDLVSAINSLYNSFMTSITYADKKLTITYRNGGTVDIDMSAIITDTNIEEFKNVNFTDLANNDVLTYDVATLKWINKAIDLDSVLQSAKDYTDEEITKSEQENAIGCDAKPTKSGDTITYVQNGETKTTTDTSKWFYYTSGTGIAQTRWISDIEYNLDLGAINLSDYVANTKVTDSLMDADKTKIPTLTALFEMHTKVNEEIGKKVSTVDIVDNLTSEATDKPLSANQGKVIQTSLDGKLNITQSVDDAGKVVKVGSDGNLTLGEGGGDATNVAYTNADHTSWNTVKKALDGIINKVYYVKPSITSFVANPAGGNFENGESISSVSFTWTTNKDVTSQTLTDCTISATDRSATYSTPITSNKTFEISVSDGENTATSSVRYTFLNGIYYGNSVIPTDYDSAFVLGLANKKLATTSKMDYSFTCGASEYAFWAVPTNMNFTSIWVNGFQADVEKVATISFTNSKGYATSYNIIKSARDSLGTFVATVK